MGHTELFRADTEVDRILDATTAGRSILTAADAAAQRTLLSVLSTAQIVAAYQPIGDYATGAEGDLATSALQPGDNVSDLVNDAGYSTFDGAYGSLSGLPTLGTAAAADTGDFATAAQGSLADSALQSGDNVSDLINDAEYLVIGDLSGYATTASLATVATSGSYDDLTDKPTIPTVAKVYEKVALSPNGAAIAAGAGKGFVPVSHAGTITAFSVQCDPNHEPTVTVEVDLNKVNTSDGTVTSVLSAVGSITSGNNSGTGTINGTQTVSVGDWLQVDIDQGSDGQDLIGVIEITPS